MEIDLIEWVPCSYCEQLVSPEHNPEMSSKLFSPNFQMVLFFSLSPRDERNKTKGWSCVVEDQHERYEMWGRGSKTQRVWDQKGFHVLLWILISVSNSKYLILATGVLHQHDYTSPANHARRGGIWPIRRHEGLSHDLAPCLKEGGLSFPKSPG